MRCSKDGRGRNIRIQNFGRLNIKSSQYDSLWPRGRRYCFEYPLADMQFLIADTFTDSLARLTGQEQKAVKTTAFDLQLDPAGKGISFHRLDRAKDANFWSVRVNRDIRLIVHRSTGSLLLCYVDHHDDAYRWAQRRKLEVHPRTGAAQLIEIRETVHEITIPQPRSDMAAANSEKGPLLFEHVDAETLLGYGVPEEWLADVLAADEDSLLQLAEHLPAEASEALLELAVGGTPEPEKTAAAAVLSPFEHPDAQRRFRVMDNVEELQRALDFPWEKWAVFLHPAQRRWVEKSYNGPARVSGSAGTGKTIVALHRAVFLARQHADARVLLTTFSEPLAAALRNKLRCLISNQPQLGERIEVHAIDTVGERLYRLRCGPLQLAEDSLIRNLLAEGAEAVGESSFSIHFLFSEWKDVVDAWQLTSWEAYRDVLRLGRKTRLPESKRVVLWSVFESVRAELSKRNLITRAELFGNLASTLGSEDSPPPFDHAVIDEAQDISISQLRFLAALGGDRPDSLFFAGDLGQRIFQQPFSWKALGVDIRGRSRTLRINYRTSHQIRSQADRLLAPELTDVDGNVERRSGTVSVFNSAPPAIMKLDDGNAELAFVADWLAKRHSEGVAPHEIGVFVRSQAEIQRAQAALERAELPYSILDARIDIVQGKVSISTMHLAKGLEFRVVAVMACDEDVIPSADRLDDAADESDLEEIYNTERHLLYVACTRSREHLLVTSGGFPSEFLDDLGD